MSKPKATNPKKSKAAEVQPPAPPVEETPESSAPEFNSEPPPNVPVPKAAPPEPTPEALPEPAPVPRARRGVAPDQTKDRVRRYYEKRGCELPKALR